MSEEWTQGEVVRALTRLSEALEKFEDSVDKAFSDLDQRYVHRAVFDARLGQVEARQGEARSWVQQILAPVVPGFVGAFLMWVATSGVIHR